MKEPLPVFEGSGLDSPNHDDLSAPEWTTVEHGYGRALPEEVRGEIDSALWWCAWTKHRGDQGIRRHELRKRVQAFGKGARVMLKAIEYPAFDLIRNNSRVVQSKSEPWSYGDPGFQAWKTLKEAGLVEYWTKRAFWTSDDETSGRMDDFIVQLHALAYLSQSALDDWPIDRGGPRESGDADCIRKVRSALERTQLPTDYRMDDGAGSYGGMSGSLPRIVRELVIVRPAAFRSGEQSTFARFIRESAGEHPT